MAAPAVIGLGNKNFSRGNGILKGAPLFNPFIFKKFPVIFDVISGINVQIRTAQANHAPFFEDAERFFEELNALIQIQMLDEMASGDVLDGIIFERPCFKQIVIKVEGILRFFDFSLFFPSLIANVQPVL